MLRESTLKKIAKSEPVTKGIGIESSIQNLLED